MGLEKYQKILVTGATGYLGSSISKGLELLGLDVTRGSRELIFPDSSSGVKWIQTKWQDSSLKFLDEFDFIIHAAGPNALICSNNIELAKFFYEDINTLLINKLSKTKNKTLILLSSVHIYGSALSGTITESNALNNSHPYVFFRRKSEKLFLNFIESGVINGFIFRLGNCFGLLGDPSGDFYKLYINQICNDIFKNKCIIIKSNPLIKKDFFPIHDLQKAIEAVISRSVNHPVYNLISGKSRTLLEVAKKIALEYHLISGYEAKISFEKKNIKKTLLALKK